MSNGRETPTEDELEFLEPVKPTIDDTEKKLEESEISYDSVRAVKDFVLSGPILGGWGPGRYHKSRAVAEEWCRAKYGEANVKQLAGFTRGRWAFLIKRSAS